MSELQTQNTPIAQENPTNPWRSLCLDWLEACALNDVDGLAGCLQATLEELRAECKPPSIGWSVGPVYKPLELVARTVGPDAVGITTSSQDTAPGPVSAEPVVEPAEEPAPAEKPKRGSGGGKVVWTDEMRAAAAARIRKRMAENPDAYKPNARAKAQANNDAPEPAQQPQTATEDTPEPQNVASPTHLVNNGNSPVAVLGTLQARQDACCEEIRQLLEDEGHVTPATLKSLAQKYNLSYVGTEQLVMDTTRTWTRERDREARRAEKAGVGA